MAASGVVILGVKMVLKWEALRVFDKICQETEVLSLGAQSYRAELYLRQGLG